MYELTGLHHAKRQAAWLRSRRIRHYVNAAGRVVVMREWLDGGEHEIELGPNFAVLRAVT